LIYLISLQLFFFVAARRKMGSDRVHSLSKRQALAALGFTTVLVFGGIWAHESYEILAVVAIYILVIGGLLLTLMVSPSLSEYYKGLWRADKMGVARLSIWDDHSISRPFVITACAIILAAASLVWYFNANVIVGGDPTGRQLVRSRDYHLAAATGVLTVAYFGLALQFFQIRFGARSSMYFGLFLFIVWVVPVLVGSILLFPTFASPSSTETASNIAYAVNPLIGIGLSATTTGSESYRTILQGVALTPALLFTFVFNSLLTYAIRRARLAVAINSRKAKDAEPAELALEAAAS
jgi:hypothetical protein